MRGSHAGQVQLLPEASLGLPGKSYKGIHVWLLPELDLEISGGGHMMNRGKLPPVLCLGQFSKWEGISRLETACQLPIRLSS